MSEPVKENLQTPEEQKSPTAPVWIFALTLLLLFVGGVYFDRYSGWFDRQVYTPYASSDDLEAYQPKGGLASKMDEGKRAYSAICAACHGDDGLGKPARPRRWPAQNGLKPSVTSVSRKSPNSV